MKTEKGFTKLCKRYNTPGHAHELTFSCFRGMPLLGNDRRRGFLADAVKEARQKHSFALISCVFMPTHAHLLITPMNEIHSTSSILLSIRQSCSRREMIWLRKHDPQELARLATGQKDKPYRFWQDGGGYDRNILNEETLRNSVSYIHNNPVRKGLVENPEQWYWSSAQDWAGTGIGPVPVDVPDL